MGVRPPSRKPLHSKDLQLSGQKMRAGCTNSHMYNRTIEAQGVQMIRTTDSTY